MASDPTGIAATLQKLASRASTYRSQKRRHIPDQIEYVILVPTLRCNLSCTYCQVSRVNQGARGFDWTDEIESAVLEYLGGLETANIKIEFQGGEPLLALDRLERVRNFCREHFETSSFAVCTNLQNLGDRAWRYFESEDTHISTSIDANERLHTKQRTQSAQATERFFANFDRAVDLFGIGKISALPTIDVMDLPDPRELIEYYVSRGLKSIYLRPVAYHGFARKKHNAKSTAKRWALFRRAFMRELVEYNFANNAHLEEYYFTYCLRRVLQAGVNGHVDLRSPNILGRDYILIDFDGRFYPTDEARMVTRSGVIDLSIGHVSEGIDYQKLAILNSEADNRSDPRCRQCRHQDYCGRDVIDDLARFGKIDVDRLDTEFCQRHMDIFDQVLEFMADENAAVQQSVAQWAGIVEFDPLLRRLLQ